MSRRHSRPGLSRTLEISFSPCEIGLKTKRPPVFSPFFLAFSPLFPPGAPCGNRGKQPKKPELGLNARKCLPRSIRQGPARPVFR